VTFNSQEEFGYMELVDYVNFLWENIKTIMRNIVIFRGHYFSQNSSKM